MADPASAPMYAPAPAQEPVMYASAPAPGPVVVVASAPPPAPAIPLGSTVRYREIPVQIQCQFCNNVTTTSTVFENGMLTWLAMGIICIFGGYCGCCLIPLCVNECKDVVHLCSNCNKMVGKYQRLS